MLTHFIQPCSGSTSAYVGSRCRVLWEEIEPAQSPTALVEDVKE